MEHEVCMYPCWPPMCYIKHIIIHRVCKFLSRKALRTILQPHYSGDATLASIGALSTFPEKLRQSNIDL